HSRGVERSRPPARRSAGTAGGGPAGRGGAGTGGHHSHVFRKPLPVTVARSKGQTAASGILAVARRTAAARPASGAAVPPQGVGESAQRALAWRPWLRASGAVRGSGRSAARSWRRGARSPSRAAWSASGTPAYVGSKTLSV